MITESDIGFILHVRATQEVRAQITLFTEQKGILTCWAMGGRSLQKKGLLQAFTPLWLNIKRKGNWHTLNTLEQAGASCLLSGANLFAGLYLNELLFRGLPKEEPSAFLYKSYCNTLEVLRDSADKLLIEASLRRFECHLLHVCGYELPLYYEAGSNQPIDAAQWYDFIPGSGFMPNNSCDGRVLGAHILALAQDKLDDLSVLKTAKWIMRRALHHALDGQPIKARELLMTNYDFS